MVDNVKWAQSLLESFTGLIEVFVIKDFFVNTPQKVKIASDEIKKLNNSYKRRK